MLNDTLATALSRIRNAEKIGRKECMVMPASKVIIAALGIMNAHRYIGSAELAKEGRGGALRVNLLGAINKCGVVKPRFAVGMADYEKFEKRYLPAKRVGILIVSTPSGMMTHEEAKKQNQGGRLIAYCY